MSSGESPRTEQTIAMVYGVSDFESAIVAIRAEAPTILTMQKMVRKIQPELFMAPCLAAMKILPNRQGVKYMSWKIAIPSAYVTWPIVEVLCFYCECADKTRYAGVLLY